MGHFVCERKKTQNWDNLLAKMKEKKQKIIFYHKKEYI